MEDTSKKFVYRDGLRFEVTPDGLFYAPDQTSAAKKHSCPDCRFCQWCADSRCNLCLPREAGGSKQKEGNEEFKMV